MDINMDFSFDNIKEATTEIMDNIIKSMKTGPLSQFDMYLTNTKDDDTFHFPVNPLDSITVNRTKKYDTVDIVDFGEVDLNNKGKKIEEISFNTFFPVAYASYCRYTNIPDPVEAVAKLTKWMESQDPQRLVITSFGFDGLVNIASMEEEEKAGENKDKYLTFTLRTYREAKVELYKPEINNTNTTLKNNRPDTKPVAVDSSRIYTVKQGDTLWGISKWWWGNGAKWPDLYNRNKSVVGSNPNLIYPGQKLVFP